MTAYHRDIVNTGKPSLSGGSTGETVTHPKRSRALRRSFTNALLHENALGILP